MAKYVQDMTMDKTHCQIRFYHATWDQVRILVKINPAQTQEEKALQKQVNKKKAEMKAEPEGQMECQTYMGMKGGPWPSSR